MEKPRMKFPEQSAVPYKYPGDQSDSGRHDHPGEELGWQDKCCRYGGK
jgi:hypothetical protein